MFTRLGLLTIIHRSGAGERVTLRLDPGEILCLLPMGLDFQGPQSVVLLIGKNKGESTRKASPWQGVGVWCKWWDLTALLCTALSRKSLES